MFKVTETGKRILHEHRYDYLKPDEDGFYEMTLWEFMHIFGPYSFMGSTDVPYVVNNAIWFNPIEMEEE